MLRWSLWIRRVLVGPNSPPAADPKRSPSARALEGNWTVQQHRPFSSDSAFGSTLGEGQYGRRNTAAASNSVPPWRPLAAQRDLTIDLERRQHPRDAEGRMDRQDLVSGQLPLPQSRLHRLFDFALRRYSEALEELPELEIKDVLIHGYLPDWDPLRCNWNYQRLGSVLAFRLFKCPPQFAAVSSLNSFSITGVVGPIGRPPRYTSV